MLPKEKEKSFCSSDNNNFEKMSLSWTQNVKHSVGRNWNNRYPAKDMMKNKFCFFLSLSKTNISFLRWLLIYTAEVRRGPAKSAGIDRGGTRKQVAADI